MNPEPTQPEQPQDELIDSALLDQALAADQSPESVEALEQKVLALTDPTTLSLLDEALAPEASDGLADRIIAATMPGAASANTAQTDEHRPAVVGRIGFTAWRYAAAAGIVLAAGVGLWLLTQTTGTPQPRIASDPDNTTPNVIAQSNGNDAANEQYAVPETTDSAYFADATQSIETRIQDVSDGLDSATIDRNTIWSELDAYEQFVNDLESDFNDLST